VQRDILKNNIFGVDLNEESVEITKLSLWLKTANKRKALTNLDNNIKCGNSLVDDPEFLKEKAFIWDNEFPNIMSKGGFDIVIGNPPYVSANNMDLTDRNYFNESEKYFSTTKKWDLYILFVEKAFEIIKDNGYFSMIIPYGILNQPFAETIRKYLLRNTKVNKILDLHDKKIFEDATVPTCVLVIKNNKNEIESNLTSIETLKIKNNFMFKELHKTPQQEFYNFEQSMIRVENIMKFKEILDKINFGNEELKNYAYVSTGAELHSKEPGGHGKFDLLYKEREDGFKPYIEGSAIEKSEKGRYCFPSIDYYLDYRAEIMRSPKFKELFESPKIIVRGSSGEFGILATFDNRKLYTSHKTTIIISKDKLPQFKKKNESSVIDIELKYILGILNSKLIDFYYQNHFSGFIDVYPTSLEKIPIAKTNNREIKEEFINKVDLLLSSRKNNKIFKIKKFKDIIGKYASEKGKSLDEIIIQSGFKNKIYSGRASKIRNFTVNINTNIITVYLDKSTSGKYEVLKFEENNKNKRKYIKYYLENLTDEQLDEIDNKYSGNILNKTLQIEIPDYNKEHVVEKVVKEWENLQQEIIGLENDIKRIDNEIDQMVYKLYNLTEKEVKVVENN
ncbi:MAG: Eco57I restriction endonuclease, partial [Halanaerobium sp. T82-1]